MNRNLLTAVLAAAARQCASAGQGEALRFVVMDPLLRNVSGRFALQGDGLMVPCLPAGAPECYLNVTLTSAGTYVFEIYAQSAQVCTGSCAPGLCIKLSAIYLRFRPGGFLANFDLHRTEELLWSAFLSFS